MALEETITLGNLITITSGILTWTITVIGGMAWLNKRFGELLKLVDYDKRHLDLVFSLRELEKRVYKIELWAARINGHEGQESFETKRPKRR